MTKWVDMELGQFVELKRGYDLPKGKREVGTVPLISSSGESDVHSEAKVKGPGVVTGRYGTIGQVFYIEKDFWPLNTTLYVKDFKGNNPLFVYYFLKTISYSDYSDKAAVPGINRNHLHKAEIRVPVDPIHQRELAEKLWILDSKIELNRQTNQTLEHIAQALFKSWFVDFDPTRAKIDAKQAGEDPERAAMAAISGKTVDELDQLSSAQLEQLKTTAALFPDALVDSELGEVPEGWHVGMMQDCCIRVESGGTPKRSEESYWGGNIKWLSSGEVRDVIVLDTKEKITEIGLKNSSAKLWPKGSTVVAMYGATAGQICLLANEMTANQACCALIPKNNQATYIFLAARRSVEDLAGKASGSAGCISILHPQLCSLFQ